MTSDSQEEDEDGDDLTDDDECEKAKSETTVDSNNEGGNEETQSPDSKERDASTKSSSTSSSKSSPKTSSKSSHRSTGVDAETIPDNYPNHKHRHHNRHHQKHHHHQLVKDNRLKSNNNDLYNGVDNGGDIDDDEPDLSSSSPRKTKSPVNPNTIKTTNHKSTVTSPPPRDFKREINSTASAVKSTSPMTTDTMSSLAMLSKHPDFAPRPLPSTKKEPCETSPRTPRDKTDEQPLDLSTKPEKLTTNVCVSLSVPKPNAPTSPQPLLSNKIILPPSPPPGPPPVSPFKAMSASNGLSSLQSLQQRFGGHSPMEVVRRPRADSVIALQPTIATKGLASTFQPPSAEENTILRLQGNATPRALPSKGDNRMSQSRSPSISPCRKGDTSNSHTHHFLGPRSEDSAASSHSSHPSGGDSKNKHVIHRCSCQKSFNSLYAMSVHIQETGHTPLSGKSMSLMDYPKLVRGQDMWLNQESEQTRRILRCMQCGESFKSLPLLTVHMMQTQHYTKIVSAEHGRRSHKCSTYCDRDMDRECIFKCKICQDAFTDMEGLANHMIVSGHHKKQASRTVSNPASVIEAANSLAASLRHGKRKRFLPEDSHDSNGFLSNSSMESKRKHHGSFSNINGIEEISSPMPSSTSPSTSEFLITCDSCGKKFDAHNFDSHVRACLRQRAKIIDALKSKLAKEEAMLSRSESKLLKSGFSFPSMYSILQDDSVESPQRKENTNSDIDTYHRKRTQSDSNMDIRINTKSPRMHSSVKQEESSNYSDFEKHPSFLLLHENRESKANGSPSERCPNSSSSGEIRHSDEPVRSFIEKSTSPVQNHRFLGNIKEEVRSPEFENNKPFLDREDCEDYSRRACSDKPTELEPEHRFLNSKLISDPENDSLDYSSSALHKLDMFSRGLTLSSKSSRSPGSNRQHTREMNGQKEKAMHRHSKVRAPTPVSSNSSISPLHPNDKEHRLITESPDNQNRPASFDILDPNADVDSETPNGSCALEAMESFIKNSFSPKSDLRSSNLVSMFSPFGNSFPLRGSIPGTLALPLNSADPSSASFAKFSKFFSMVPGAGLLAPTDTNSTSLSASSPSGLQNPFKDSSKRTVSKADSSSASPPPLMIPAFQTHKPTSSLPWKHKIHSDKSGSSSMDLRRQMNKIGDSVSSTSSSTIHFLHKRNNTSIPKSIEEPVEHNHGESRLPSSVELHERQDFLRKKRKITADNDRHHSSISPRPDTSDSKGVSKSTTNHDDNLIKTEQSRNSKSPSNSIDEMNKLVYLSPSRGSYKSPQTPSTSPRPTSDISESTEGENMGSDAIAYTDRKKTALSPSDNDDDDELDSKASLQNAHSFPSKHSNHRCSNQDSSQVHHTPTNENKLCYSSGSFKAVNDEEIIKCNSLNRNYPSNARFNESKDLIDDPCLIQHELEVEKEAKSIKFNHSKVKEEKVLKKISSNHLSSNEEKDDSFLLEVSPETSSSTTKKEIEDNVFNESGDNDIMIRKTTKKRNDISLSPKTRSDKEDGVLLSKNSEKEKCDSSGNLFRNDSPLCDGTQRRDSENPRKNSMASIKTNRDDEEAGEKLEEVCGSIESKSKTSSALDSLSSFVYNQPLTTEHPLDSLQRLFTPRETIRLSNSAPATSTGGSSVHFLRTTTGASGSPLNLTTRGSDPGSGSTDCGSSEENEDHPEADVDNPDGCLPDGELAEFKCAACNRTFASKGSYRYHLSRCHLSSVKKYGIKEAFNMSPYVYLPLDHTAKFSKYYQMAQELANKGK